LRLEDFDAGACVGTQDEEAEYDELNSAKEKSERVFKIFRRYHSPEVRSRYHKIQSFPADFVPAQLLRLLQDAVLNALVERQVVIETLPSSNVRISFYEDFSQHHFLRWLGLNDGSKGPRPRVCIGSDDPGIFACSLRGEYIHVLREATQATGCEQTALDHIRAIRDAGHLYRFT
jgi:hypothetical protein